MRARSASVVLFAVLTVLSSAYIAAGCIGGETAAAPGPDAAPDVTADTAPAGDAGAHPVDSATTPIANGLGCSIDTDCASGHCADFVCCESACMGTCERCDYPDASGTCTAVQAGHDPDHECATPSSDAGAADAAADGAGTEGGAEAGLLALPEAGVIFDDTTCAAACNGDRACAFPDKTTACGSTFCADGASEGHAACDGRGRCGLVVDACQAYACTPGASGCNTTCAAPSDCLPADYCNASGACAPKIANGAACATSAQCANGNCVALVCCSDPCTGYAGASCATTGNVGTCMCDACTTGPCKTWYLDSDGDSFGDPNTILPGCAGGPAPQTGYVANGGDCDDTNPDVFPGQTAYFATPRADDSFDYDCSGASEKETPEFVGASCAFCQTNGYTCAAPAAACASAGDPSSLGCDARATACGELVCVACGANENAGFTASVDCGATGTLTTCGACAAAGGAPTGTATSSSAQRCR